MFLRRQLIFDLILVLAACAAPTPQPTATPTLTPNPPAVETPTPTSGLVPFVELVASLLLAPRGQYVGEEFRHSWSPEGNGLAFFYQDALWVAEAADFQARFIADEGGSATGQPYWSPQGDRIAFRAGRPIPEGEEWAPGTIWLVNADGSGLRDLLPGDKAYLSVSTGKTLLNWLDKQTISFSEHCGVACEVLYLLDVEDGELTALNNWVENGQIMGPQAAAYHWAPIGDTVAAVSFLRGLPEIALISSTTPGSFSYLFHGPEVFGEWEAFEDWAPDASAFLFTFWQTAETEENPWPVVAQPVDLYLWDIAQEEARLLAPNASWAAWASNRRAVAFYLFGNPELDSEGRIIRTDFQPGKPFSLYAGMLDPESGKVWAWVPAGEADFDNYNNFWFWFQARRPVWSPDDEYFVFWDANGAVYLFSAPFSHTQARYIPLASAEAGVISAAWSPDGEYLALATAGAFEIGGTGEPGTLWIVRAP